MKKISFLTAFLIILPFLLISCKDDIITPKPPITTDSTDVYDWQVISRTGPMRGVFVADSNNVFINGTYYKPLFYNGQTIQEIELNDPSFEFILVGGYDKNNVIFGGGQIPYNDPVIKKWTNGNIMTYTILKDSGVSVHDILMEGPDQAWVSSIGSNKIYYFNAGTFNMYPLDDSIEGAKFFKNLSGQLYVFGRYVERRPSGIPLEMLYTYKYTNNQFQLISRDSTQPPSDKTHYVLKCGTDMFMVAHPDAYDQIYWFNGNSWEYYLTPPGNDMISNLGGTSKDYFLKFSGSVLSINIWNGNWRKEDSLKFPNYPPFFSIAGSSIIIKDSDVYFTAEDKSGYTSFLIIGKKKSGRKEDFGK